MHVSTENLLNIRDDELVDVEIRIAVDDHQQLQTEIDDLRKMQNALQSLPSLKPPSGMWEKIADASFGSSKSTWEWPLRGMIVATVAVAAILVVMRSPWVPEFNATVPKTTIKVADTNLTQQLATSAYASLVAESEGLERQLSQIGYQPRLISAGTTSTIASLEDEIALVDAQLMYARTLQPMETEALWESRVGLMDALVNVRYTHSQLSGF